VIIPEEINLKWTAETQKPNYNYDFSFAHPYLHLIIEEFGNVYDGTNDISRRSFCKLIFDKKYCTPNGRSFLILKPMQGETKLFYPSPLSSMPRLTMSLVRPTGQLLNDSYDAYKIFKIDYEVFNANYLAIVSDEYFDRNEYYVGDTVVLKGFTGPLHQDLVNFINRPEGHEVLELGTANENGYYRSFYIQTLGVFDKKQGSFNVDTDAITALNNYNNTIDYETTTDTNGVIMNLSLQHSISMNLVTREADVGHQSTNLFTQRS
jgi:signal peptidase I